MKHWVKISLQVNYFRFVYIQFELRHSISNKIRAIWSESSLGTLWVAKEPKRPQADSEDSDQTTAWMCRLIWVLAKRRCNPLGNTMPRHKWFHSNNNNIARDCVKCTYSWNGTKFYLMLTAVTKVVSTYKMMRLCQEKHNYHLQPHKPNIELCE